MGIIKIMRDLANMVEKCAIVRGFFVIKYYVN